MADIHKIHPSPNPEAAVAASPPPSSSLIPSSSTKSDEHFVDHPLATLPPPSPPRRHRLCRYICCTVFLLLLLLILFAGVFTAVLFLAFHPKIPHYSIDSIHVTTLNISSAAALSATFAVNITARNPNKHIGIYYNSGSRLGVWLNDTELCHGSLPDFYQGHRNTTVMRVALSGQTANATVLTAELLAEESASGGVQLGIRGKVPVRLKMGKLKLMKMKFKATCKLVVTSLSANNQIRIKSSSCKIKLHKILGISL